jgi:CheY-like chemotaxis protein
MAKIILVVDDEPANVFLLKKIFEKCDYNVLTAHSGAECLRKLEANHVDMVLLDLMMPGINGFEVLSRMKNNVLTQTIPVIVLTALNDIRTKEKVDVAGAVNFIIKPISKNGILNAVSAVLEEKNISRGN